MNKIYTHQPFLFKKNNKIKLLYCQSEEGDNITSARPWKIFVKDLDSEQILKINTPFSKIFSGDKNNALIECNPSLHKLGNSFFLTYIKGVLYPPLKYNLVQYEVPDLDFNKIKNFNILKSNIFSGCVLNKKIYSLKGQGGKVILIEAFFKRSDAPESINCEDFNFQSFIRVNSIFEQNKLIITGLSKEPNSIHKSYIYNVDKKCVERELLNKNGDSLYKSSIIDNKLAYAIKLNGFENREIQIEDFN